MFYIYIIYIVIYIYYMLYIIHYSRVPSFDSLDYIGKIIKIWRQIKLIFYKLKHTQKHSKLKIVKTFKCTFFIFNATRISKVWNLQNQDLHSIILCLLFQIINRIFTRMKGCLKNYPSLFISYTCNLFFQLYWNVIGIQQL